MRPTRGLRQRLGLPLLALLAVTLVGAVGYMLIDGWSFADGLFMAATSVTTVGFGEVRPLSQAARLWTLLLIAVGLALLWYGLSVLVGAVVEGDLSRNWEARRMERRLGQVSGHHIVCGFGRVGRGIAQQLRRDGREVVVVDNRPESLAEAHAAGFATVLGDATEDAVLRQAGIERAAGLSTVVGSDADNVFVTLSARALNPGMPIVARADHDEAVPKLKRAGATQVVSPYDMAGRQMARLSLRPATVAFVENLFRGDAGPLLEEVELADGSWLVGRTVAEARRELPQLSLVAVNRAGESLVPPPADLRLQKGDVLAAVGDPDALAQLERASHSD